MTLTDTRRRVLDVALECFLADGYEQTTIARIRKLSGTSNGALFHHFASKEAIADALYVEAIASFQAGLWELLSRKPASLHDAVHGAIAHQLTWTEQNAALARFVYARGHLDWNSPQGAELAALNSGLAAAFKEWMAPLVRSGEIRPGPMLLITAVVSGPAHAIAQRWLAGQVDRPLTSFVDELTDAACAGLRATPATGAPAAGAAPASGTPADGTPAREPAPPVPARSRVTLELLADDGSVLARSQASARLTPGTGP
jgi:AcrR family transcriptional regulator